MTALIDETDARILELIQRGFPLDAKPFDVLAKNLSIGSEDVLARIERLKSNNVIRQISAIFNSAALGYHSTLIAFKVSDELLGKVAAEVSKHLGVSHCYSRDADYNLWFTLTVASEDDLESKVYKLVVLDGVLAHMLLPAIKVFKIGVFLSMGGEWGMENRFTPSPEGEGRGEGSLQFVVESEESKAAVKALQCDLPLVGRPFRDLAEQVGISEDEIIGRARGFLNNGVMRRYAAVLNHGKTGYAFNAMVCWRIPLEIIEETGDRLSQHPSVSHCYQRPTFPDWPYSLYTMVHARSQYELDKIISDLVFISANADHVILNTITEYKKSRILYFQ